MILITGIAGFIGFHTAKTLLKQGETKIIGLDNLNDYYDVSLKEARLEDIKNYGEITFYNSDISDKSCLDKIADKHKNQITNIIHLAAQAGVRYSIENPQAYMQSNLAGHFNMLEFARSLPSLRHMVYASSSSVYGNQDKQPFSTLNKTDHPVSFYAATKKSNEIMSHSYSHLFHIPMTGLRFFTVYGPWGRPDMAYFNFTRKILSGEPIEVYNNGQMRRDFTYIDDCVDGILKALDHVPDCTSNGNILHKIYNLGNNKPVRLMDFIETLEKHLGQEAEKIMKPMQDGDVQETYADIEDSIQDFGYKPSTNINDGLKEFVDWYKAFYQD